MPKRWVFAGSEYSVTRAMGSSFSDRAAFTDCFDGPGHCRAQLIQRFFENDVLRDRDVFERSAQHAGSSRLPPTTRGKYLEIEADRHDVVWRSPQRC